MSICKICNTKIEHPSHNNGEKIYQYGKSGFNNANELLWKLLYSNYNFPKVLVPLVLEYYWFYFTIGEYVDICVDQKLNIGKITGVRRNSKNKQILILQSFHYSLYSDNMHVQFKYISKLYSFNSSSPSLFIDKFIEEEYKLLRNYKILPVMAQHLFDNHIKFPLSIRYGYNPYFDLLRLHASVDDKSINQTIN